MEKENIRFNEDFVYDAEKKGKLLWGVGIGKEVLDFSFETKKLRKEFLESVLINRELINFCDKKTGKRYKMTDCKVRETNESEEKIKLLRVCDGDIEVYTILFYFEEV